MQVISKIRFVAIVFSVALIVVLGKILLAPSPHFILLISPYICPNATYFIPTQKPLIALTIDDSPSKFTADILTTLKKYDVKATFFPISSKVKTQKDIIEQIIQEKHEIGNHLTKDEPSIKLGDKFETELLKADKVLSELTMLNWLRPGNGFCNSAMRATAQKHNYKVVLGSVWSYDTHVLSSKFSSWFILHNIKPGAIIVLHDSSGRDRRGSNTIKTLNIIIPQLQQQGYRFVTLTKLVELTQIDR